MAGELAEELRTMAAWLGSRAGRGHAPRRPGAPALAATRSPVTTLGMMSDLPAAGPTRRIAHARGGCGRPSPCSGSGSSATVFADGLVHACPALLLLLLVSLFLSLAIEPGVNRLARRGWRRGTATMRDPARRARRR